MLKITFNKLSTKSLHDLGRRVLALLLTLVEGILKGNPLVADLKRKFEEYDEVIIKKRSVKMGVYLREKDNFRDKMYSGFNRAVRGVASFEGTAKGAAAAKLLALMPTVTDVKKLNYEEQNPVMDKLIAAFDTEANTALITTIGLNEEYAVFKKAQADFKAIADEQSSGNAELKDTPYASRVRADLEGALRNIFSLVSALREQPEWKSTYNLLAQYIKDAESIGPKKKKKPADGKEPAADEAPSTEPATPETELPQ